MRLTVLLLGTSLAASLVGSPATALQVPDIVASRIGVNGSNTSDFKYHGQSGGIAAYSFATTSCNIGTWPANWSSSTLHHPVIGQNVFRWKDGRFEQMGQSWLKHGFCAVNETSCGSCQTTGCSSLGVGCADTYSATLNDGAGGRPKWEVNVATGAHIHASGGPAGPGAIRGRLQIPVSDVDPGLNAGARYFAEAQYVAHDDSQAGNHKNNASWREIAFPLVNVITQASPTTQVGQPGIYAWQAVDPAVTIVEIMVADEGGPGVHGWYFLGYRVTDQGGGVWSYNYAVQNLTSKRAVRSLILPLASGAQISDVHFRGVPYHSGDVYSNDPWVYVEGGGEFGWVSPETHAENPLTNALRWGTLYAFGFTATSGPVAGSALMELFEPGSPDELAVPVLVPDVVQATIGTAYCFGDGSVTPCPCNNSGEPGRGCENGSFEGGARLRAFGSASIAADDLVFLADRSTPNAVGILLQGNNAVNDGLGLSFGDGLRCAGGALVRLQTLQASPSGDVESSVSIATVGGVLPGDTKRYQWWYRDPVLSPCKNFFNLTNGLELTWGS